MCSHSGGQYEPELFPGLIYRMKQPKIVLLIFVSGKIVLTGAKVISLDSFFLFCPPRFYMLFWLDLISIVSFRILRWEMRPIQPLRTYTRCLQSSGKTSNGMLHNCNIFVKIHGAGTRLFMLNPTLIYRFHVKSFSKGYLCSQYPLKWDLLGFWGKVGFISSWGTGLSP